MGLAGPLLWTLYILWPSAGWGWLSGVPLGAVSALALGGVWWRWTVGARRPAWRIATALLVLKIAGTPLLVDRGFAARYFAAASTQAPVERTRIDPEIAFGPAESRDLPLFFFNDFLRFNFYRADEPLRATLPYAVEWSGDLQGADDASAVFLSGERVRGEIEINATPVVSLSADQPSSRAPVHLSAGWHHLVIRVVAPPGAGRSIRAGLVGSDGVERPFGDRDVYVHRVPRWRLTADRIVGAASWPLDALALIAIVCGVAGGALAAVTARHAAAPLAALIAIAEASWFARPWLGRVMPLAGGSDMLTYETYARDILLHGPLMTLGHAPGSVEPFYYQPLYPYVLALLHASFGEGYFGIVFVQRLMVAMTVGVVWRITHVLYGRRAGATAAVVAALVLYTKLGPWASVLLGEILFVPLVCAWALASIAVMCGDTGARWGAGIAGGLATLSRSTLLLAWLPVWAVQAATPPRSRRTLAALATSILLTLAIVSVATARNWMVSRTFVPITTSFAVNFYLGNQPPAGAHVPVHAVSDHAFYQWFARDDRTRAAIEFARHAPGMFARNLANKALYTLGFFGAYGSGSGWSPLLVLVWSAAVAGAFVRHERTMTGGRAVAAIPAVVAATHFAAVTMIFPDSYGDRLILPFYALILPYASLTCWAALKASAGVVQGLRARVPNRS